MLDQVYFVEARAQNDNSARVQMVLLEWLSPALGFKYGSSYQPNSKHLPNFTNWKLMHKMITVHESIWFFCSLVLNE